MSTHNGAEPSRDMPLPATLVKSSTSRHRLRRLTGKDLPLVISIVAVIIALLTYIDQHDIERATVIAGEETYAAKVGFWLVNPAEPNKLPEIDVDNAGVLPISNVRVLITATGYPTVLPPGTESYLFVVVERYPVPPCKILTVAAEQAAVGSIRPLKGITYKFSIQSIDFTDASGLTWARSVDGALTPASGGRSGDGQSLGTAIPSNFDMTNAAGCT